MNPFIKLLELIKTSDKRDELLDLAIRQYEKIDEINTFLFKDYDKRLKEADRRYIQLKCAYDDVLENYSELLRENEKLENNWKLDTHIYIDMTQGDKL